MAEFNIPFKVAKGESKTFVLYPWTIQYSSGAPVVVDTGSPVGYLIRELGGGAIIAAVFNGYGPYQDGAGVPTNENGFSVEVSDLKNVYRSDGTDASGNPSPFYQSQEASIKLTVPDDAPTGEYTFRVYLPVTVMYGDGSLVNTVTTFELIRTGPSIIIGGPESGHPYPYQASYHALEIACMELELTAQKQDSDSSGDHYIITAKPTGGEAPYDFDWSLSGCTGTPTGGSAGSPSYAVTVPSGGSASISCTATDSGDPACSASDSISFCGLGVSISVEDAEHGEDGTTLHLKANVSGGSAPYQIDWASNVQPGDGSSSGGSGSSAPEAIPGAGLSDTYTVTYPDGGTCYVSAKATDTGGCKGFSPRLCFGDCGGLGSGAESYFETGSLPGFSGGSGSGASGSGSASVSSGVITSMESHSPLSSSAGLPTSSGASSSGAGTSLGSSGTSSGGVPTSSGASSTGGGSSSAPSGTSSGGVATDPSESSTGGGSSVGSSGSTGSAGTSSGGVPTSSGVPSSAMATSEPLSGTSAPPEPSGTELPPGTDSGAGEPCCPPGYIWDELRGACVPGYPVRLAPLKPDPPRLVSKARDQITVKSALWDPTDPRRPINGMDWERIEIPVGGDPIQGTWVSSADSYMDVSVARAGVYHYRNRAFNEMGYSPWSDPLEVSLVSTRAHVTITEPQNEALLINSVLLRMTITDSGSGSRQRYFEIGGYPWPTEPVLVPGGTIKNGSWRALWDTVEWLQGDVTIRGFALGSDGFWAVDEVEVTLQNSLANNVLVCDVGPLTTPDGLAYDKAHVSIQVPTLSTRPGRQWWAVAGLRRWNNGAADPVASPPSTPEEAVTQMALHEAVSFGDGKVGPDALRRLYRANPRLSKLSQNVVLRVLLYRRELETAFKIAPSTVAFKAREDGDDLIIFGKTPASVWRFNGSGASLVVDLTSKGAGTATDAALLGDKVLALLPGGTLRLVDTDPGGLSFTIQVIRESGTPEPRPAKKVEAVGGAFWVWCINPSLMPKTVVYKLTGNQLAQMWTLAGEVSLVDVVASTGMVAMSVGADLYTSNTGSAPTLSKHFSAPITALSRSRAGLSSGAVWDYTPDVWSEERSSGGAVQAVGEWKGAGDILRGVIVEVNSAQLMEEGTGGEYGPGKLIENPTATPDTLESVVALRRFVETVEIPPSESGSAPGEISTREKDSLVVLTKADGLVIVLSESSIKAGSGARLVSELPVIQLAPGGAKRALPASV